MIRERIRRWPRTGLTLCIIAALSTWAQATTLVYQDTPGGYAATADGYISENSPSSSFGTAQSLGWDSDDPSGSGRDKFALIRFDGIFGTNGAQIPVGAQITSAVVTYNVSNVGADGQVCESLVDWTESVTYNTFGNNGTPGVQPSERGPALATALGFNGVRQFNVTVSLAAWSQNPAANRGWIILPVGSDGVDIRSSEYTAVFSQRPKLTVVFNEGPPTPLFERQPYLQSGTPDSVVVSWRTDVPTNGVVNVGLDVESLDMQFVDPAVSRDHAVPITGLAARTKYYYAVGTDGRTLAPAGDSNYFITSPAPGAMAPFTAWIVGDSGEGNVLQMAVRDAMLAYTSGDPPDIALHMGDMAYEEGTDGQLTVNFFAPYQAIFRHTLIWPTFGNHEGYSSSSAAQTGPYYVAFTLPSGGQAGGLPSETEAYYAFDYANVHFICLGSFDNSRAPGSPMLNWLAADMAATDKAWIVAFFHHPPYTKSNHDSDNVNDSDGIMRDMRENVLPVLEAGGVDLVLCGHAHNYERTYLVNGAYDTPTTAAGHIVDPSGGNPATTGPYLKPGGRVPNAGAVYVVAGHGGTTTEGPGGHPLVYYRDMLNGSCLLHFDRNVARIENLRYTGVISDEFAIVKGAHTGDCDADGHLAAADFEFFAGCIGGPAVALTSLGCMCADFNADGAVDLADYAGLQRAAQH